MNPRTAAIVLALVAAPLLAGAAPPPNFKLKPGAEGKLCLDCHSGQLEAVLKKPFVHTPVKSRQCIGCHNPHASEHGKLLGQAPNASCAACHKNVVPKAPVSTHKPIAEKGCVACHDPHASGFKANLVKSEQELCGSCHKPVVEAAKKARFKHAPIERSGCVTCHDPHGSAKAGVLLKDDVPGLCVGCHKTDRPIFAKQHQGYSVGKSRCTSCHDPHGSSQRGMLYDTVHAPVAKAMCGQCHDSPTSPTALKPKQQGLDLCRGCHSTQMTAMFDKGRIHRPLMEKQACLSCHTPHASRTSKLIKGRMTQVCGACHADTIKRQEVSVTKHEPVQDGDCAACHEVHSSNTALMFKNPDVPQLCGKCHDWLQHSSHPMGEKTLDPRNKNLQVQCLSCHRTHGTEFKHFMPYATNSELCTKCHATFRR
jgi:predicted CXXCH cytochrome family protein